MGLSAREKKEKEKKRDQEARKIKEQEKRGHRGTATQPHNQPGVRKERCIG